MKHESERFGKRFQTDQCGPRTLSIVVTPQGICDETDPRHSPGAVPKAQVMICNAEVFFVTVDICVVPIHLQTVLLHIYLCAGSKLIYAENRCNGPQYDKVASLFSDSFLLLKYIRVFSQFSNSYFLIIHYRISKIIVYISKLLCDKKHFL